MKQGSGDTIIIPIFSNINIMHAVLLSAIIIVSPLPCSLPFYTTIAFKSYIPLTFSERMFFFFYLVQSSISATDCGHHDAQNVLTSFLKFIIAWQRLPHVSFISLCCTMALCSSFSWSYHLHLSLMNFKQLCD